MLELCDEEYNASCSDTLRLNIRMALYASLHSLQAAYLFCLAHVSFKPTVLLNTGRSAEVSVSAMK